MATKGPQPLSILPLPGGTVLLPGISARIPVSGRSDIPALLSSFFSSDKGSGASFDTVTIGCVPLRSFLLRSDGAALHKKSKRPKDTKLGSESRPDHADHNELFEYGTLAKVVGVQGQQPDELYLVVHGVQRFRIDRFVQMKPYFMAEVAYQTDDSGNVPSTGASFQAPSQEHFDQLKTLSIEILDLFRLSAYMPHSHTRLSPFLIRRLESYISKKTIAEAGALADFMANLVEITLEEKLRILAAVDPSERVQAVSRLLTESIKDVKESSKITIISTQESAISQKERESLLRKAIGQLSDPSSRRPPNSRAGGEVGDDEPNEMEELQQRLEESDLSEEARKVADKELKRLKKMNPAQAEYGVCRTYLETIADIPWMKGTDDKLGPDTLKRARKQLDDDHYGLEDIKKRLIEYLAVLRLKQAMRAKMDHELATTTTSTASTPPSETRAASHIRTLIHKRHTDRSPILLLVGPPGTGKTSLARSVADALGRKFHRISLGGVRDEAEIRGHRRTYVAAMPGLIATGLRKVGTNNPVFLLDEIDKISGNTHHGDPAAAMLEVLDPEQNNSFTDHYLNIPLDLSHVLFIATANSLETISPPLLDRLERIELSGYTTLEKREIARRHLLPKQISAHGLEHDQIELPTETLDKVITSYTREAGVRNLERELGTICRSKAVAWSDAQSSTSSPDTEATKPSLTHTYSPTILPQDLVKILGTHPYSELLADPETEPGTITGLVAYSTGSQGSILFIEMACMPGGTGKIHLTGNLGDVLRESVRVALSWVQAHAYELGLVHAATIDVLGARDLHVHCPSGGIPKDGPSAGLAHVIALVSLFRGVSVPPCVAMTGEISLRGRVLGIGGVKGKLVGALRAGVKVVLLPVENRREMRDVPAEVAQGMEIVFVRDAWEAIGIVWPRWDWRTEGAGRPLEAESRL